jgi:hypothetical protein
MNRFMILLVGVVVAAALSATDGFARGGGGGGGGRGGGGGGGGARGGGGFSGGARPSASPAMNRSPSMSRAAPSPAMNRPAQLPTASRPAQSVGGQRPAAGTGQGIAANRPSQLPATRPGTGTSAGTGRPGPQSPGSYQRPSQGQVSNFLNMPTDFGGGQIAGSAPHRPAQLPAGGVSGGKTVTGPGGGQVTVGGVGGSRTGPGGTTIGAGRAGVKVTGPGGNTYTKVAGGAAIRGPGGNTIAAGRGASFVNGQFVGGKSWAAVNGSFTRWNCFTPGWYGRYPGAWWPGRWAVAATAWTAATWATAGAYCGCSGSGVYYDYGENVTYDDGVVYYGDQAYRSADQYYADADELAAGGQETQDEEWLPLGVFAVIAEPTQTQSDKVVQLALNKEGAIRGNLQDSLSDKVIPVVGAVDKKTQRAALKLEGNDSVVVETGLYDLTNDEVPVLIHFGPDRQETRTLIRLQPPEEQAQQRE